MAEQIAPMEKPKVDRSTASGIADLVMVFLLSCILSVAIERYDHWLYTALNALFPVLIAYLPVFVVSLLVRRSRGQPDAWAAHKNGIWAAAIFVLIFYFGIWYGSTRAGA